MHPEPEPELIALREENLRLRQELETTRELLQQLQGMTRRHAYRDGSDPLTVLKDVLLNWQDVYHRGELMRYLETIGEGGVTLLQEDLEDCQLALRTLEVNRGALLDDLKFLEETCRDVVDSVDRAATRAPRRQPQPAVDLNAVVANAVALTRDGLRRSGISVDEAYADGLSPVRIDPNDLARMFAGLLRSAQQATGRNGTVHISTSSGPGRIELHLNAEGPGRDPDGARLARIFTGGAPDQPPDGESQEWRLENAPLSGTAGGHSSHVLALSRRCARRYHGDVSVEWTSPGQETRFMIWLPVEPVQSGHPDPAALIGDLAIQEDVKTNRSREPLD